MLYYLAMPPQNRSGIEQERRFAARVRAVRVHRNWSHGDLAERVGLNRMAVANIETHRRRVTLSEAIDLAAELGVPLGDMLSPAPLVLVQEVRLD